MSTRPLLKKGSTGSDVVDLQSLLCGRGFTLDTDGIFGNGTHQVVRQFQASEGLESDGIVGSKTWGVLEALPEEPPLLDLIPDGIESIQRKALEVAIGDLGKKEVPNGSNSGPEIAHLVQGAKQYWWDLKRGSDGEVLPGLLDKVKKRGYAMPDEVQPPDAWCGYAVTNWVRLGYDLAYWDLGGYRVEMAGHPLKYFQGSPTAMEDQARQLGTWTKSSSGDEALAGAFYTMSRGSSGSDPTQTTGAGHTGLILCDHGDGTVTCIDGNYGNKVWFVRRKKTSIRGWSAWWEKTTA